MIKIPQMIKYFPTLLKRADNWTAFTADQHCPGHSSPRT
jgi:hypothetical protein